MAKRGPKPKTAKTTRPPSGSTRKPTAWAVPRHLTGEATKAWTHVVALLQATGNLDRTDPMLVEAYAINVQLLRAAQESIRQDGVLIEGRFEAKQQNPACNIVNTATMRLKAIINDLGLCPASSKYAASPDATTVKDNKWDGLLGVVG